MEHQKRLQVGIRVTYFLHKGDGSPWCDFARGRGSREHPFPLHLKELWDRVQEPRRLGGYILPLVRKSVPISMQPFGMISDVTPFQFV